MSFNFKILIALTSGAALSFSQAPYELWFLVFPCFGVFYYLYQTLKTKKQVFILTFVFALGYFISGLYWIGNALLVEGNPYKWAWPLAVVALPALLSLFSALYLTINFILFRKNALSHFIGFVVLLGISEWVRGHAFTGFPWNLYGYGMASLPAMSQSLSLIGPYGLTWVTIFLGTSIGYILTRKQYYPFVLVVAAFTFGSLYHYGNSRLNKVTNNFNDDVLIHIVQPNIKQSEKWKPEKFEQNFQSHLNALKQLLGLSTKHIVVWPETAIPPALLNRPQTHKKIHDMLGDNATLLSGALTIEQKKNKLSYYNALLAWQGNQPPQKIYSKSHLVPFGEYIPFQKYIPIPTVTNFSGFERGQGSTTLTLNGLPSFSPLICYEIIFPHKAVSQSKPRPDFILTITNDGWYGDSAGPHQHFTQARFRAIEQGIPVVRSANTGISGVIDLYGRVLNYKEIMTQGIISTRLPKTAEYRTLYSKHGDWPVIIICLMLLMIRSFSIRH